jgi:hypothetical protein
MYTVEQDVPLPAAYRHRKARVWPFGQMEVGDSFIVHDPDKWDYTQQCASIYGKRLKRKFTTRKMEDGLRVWRIA